MKHSFWIGLWFSFIPFALADREAIPLQVFLGRGNFANLTINRNQEMINIAYPGLAVCGIEIVLNRMWVGQQQREQVVKNLIVSEGMFNNQSSFVQISPEPSSERNHLIYLSKKKNTFVTWMKVAAPQGQGLGAFFHSLGGSEDLERTPVAAIAVPHLCRGRAENP